MTASSPRSVSADVSRAYAPHEPSFQRFHEFAAPLASSSGAGSVAAAAESSGGRCHPYARQYSHVYSARLTALRERCLARARASLEEDGGIVGAREAERIIEVKEGAWSILVGTIVKETDPKRRPAVETKYDDASDARAFLFPAVDGGKGRRQESLRSHPFDPERGDVLHLEDESGRVELAPEAEEGGADGPERSKHALDPNRVATGVVAAVVGRVCAAKGIMRVRSIHFAGPPPSDGVTASDAVLRGPTTANEEEEADEEEPVLLLVSGLGCGSDSPVDAGTGASLALRREMLLDYLTDPSPQYGGASVCRVIVAGGGVTPPAVAEEESDKENVSQGRKNYNSVANNNSKRNKAEADLASNRAAFALRELDLYLSELLGGGVPVDYVPGWHDPTNANWPQRPLHSCLLPLSCGYVDLFGRGTNPYEAILGGGDGGNGGGVRVLGSDGLNVADLRRFLAKKEGEDAEVKAKGEDEDGGTTAAAASCIDALNRTLEYGHMAPTGPDSLPTFPSFESDPFVLKSSPGVYFAGNCEKFETRLVDGDGEEMDGGKEGRGATRLVCVPSFALTGEVVLVKLKSLECEVVSFNDASL